MSGIPSGGPWHAAATPRILLHEFAAGGKWLAYIYDQHLQPLVEGAIRFLERLGDARALHAAVSPPVIPAQAGIQVSSLPASGCRITSGMTGAYWHGDNVS